MFAAVVTKEATPPPTVWTSIETWPQWLQVLVGTVVAVVFLWVFAKVVKWSLYILIWLVLIGGLATAIWLFLQ